MRRPVILVALLALLLAGCSAAPSTQRTSITVYAATSLTAAFEQIAEEFASSHPEVKIAQLSFDGSATLATQITAGAPAQVFASADERNMLTVSEAGLAKNPTIFATNTLVIATPKDNPGQVATLTDLAEVTTVLCAPQVPCGAAAQALLEQASVSVQVASLEQNVGAVLTKVATGEADAGLVYRTDVVNQEVFSIVPEGAQQVVNSYPVAALETEDSAKAAAAQEFVDFVVGEAGQKILAEHGFGAPG